jgi:serpin B
MIGFQMHDVVLTMPKFRYETPVVSLKDRLAAVGMPDAFSRAAADFSGISEASPDLPIYIGDILHKAFIDVDERRTEAAAVTVVEPLVGAAPDEPTEPPPIVVKIDRPFIFFIRDTKTNAILFVGRVMNPASK